MARVLILGGTSDGRFAADLLDRLGVRIVYAIAGLVRQPNVNYELVSWGFAEFGGLDNYIKEKEVAVILDLTHPYATKISKKAVAAAKRANICCWRYERPPWKSQVGDEWQVFDRWKDLLPTLVDKKVVFFTTGQISQLVIDKLYVLLAGRKQKQLIRTAVPPKISLPPNMEWIEAIGPFGKNEELETMKGYGVDVLVTKNSGGELTMMKLSAARELGIPVAMLARPEPIIADKIFDSKETMLRQFVDEFIV